MLPLSLRAEELVGDQADLIMYKDLETLPVAAIHLHLAVLRLLNEVDPILLSLCMY